MELMDQLFGSIRRLDPQLALKYNKFYVLPSKDGVSETFVHFRPRKKSLLFEIRLKRSDDVDSMIEKSGLDALEYDSKWGYYRFKLTKADLEKQGDLLTNLVTRAFDMAHAP